MDKTVKQTAGKIRWHLLPWQAVREIVKVLEFGALKYEKHGWVTNPGSWQDFGDAIVRHYYQWLSGEDRDQETGLLHMSHIGCNSLFLAYYALKNIGKDDRTWKHPGELWSGVVEEQESYTAGGIGTVTAVDQKRGTITVAPGESPFANDPRVTVTQGDNKPQRSFLRDVVGVK
jgi:hypothetical protein